MDSDDLIAFSQNGLNEHLGAHLAALVLYQQATGLRFVQQKDLSVLREKVAATALDLWRAIAAHEFVLLAVEAFSGRMVTFSVN